MGKIRLYKVRRLEDGIRSYDCTVCGHSDLEAERADAHGEAHKTPARAGDRRKP